MSHPSGGLGTTYDVHLGLIGKCVVNFVLVIMELFSLGVTAGSRIEGKRKKRETEERETERRETEKWETEMQ